MWIEGFAPRTCDSRPMCSGRRQATLILAAVVALSLAATGNASTSGGAPETPKKKLPIQILKGRVVSDGTLSVGQQEWIAVKGMPPRTKLRVAVEPLASTPQCSTPPWLCDLVWVRPAPDSAPFRTSGKGRALISFITPTTFTLENFFRPKESHQEPFVDGQRVHVDVIGAKQRPHRKRREVGLASGRAGIDGPPPGG
jgi:hypothetical protein